MIYVRLIFLLISFLAGMGLSSAQTPFIRNYSLNEQNAPVKVNDLLQDDDGYIWLAADNGLYSFNGERFLKIPDSFHRPAICLAAYKGKLFAGFKDGNIGVVADPFKKELQFLKQKVTNPILCILSDTATRSLWLGTEGGIFRLKDDSLRTFLNTSSGLSDNFVYTLNKLPWNRFLVGTDNGINDVQWQGGRPLLRLCNTSKGLRDNIVRVIRRLPGKNVFWIGMQQGGIALYDAASRSIKNFSLTGDWSYGQVNDILPVTADHAWVATQSGYLLDVYLDNSFAASIKPYHYPDQQFQKLIEDRSGNIWCATQKGLSMVTAEYMNKIALPSPYALQQVTAIACDREGNLWMAQNRDLYQVSLHTPHPFMQKVYQAPVPISCLFSDPENRLWIGTMGNGLSYRDEQGHILRLKGAESVRNENILSISGTSDRLWMAALTGVYEFAYPDKQKKVIRLIKHHNKQSGIGSDYVYFLFPDHKEQIWMATDGAGICMYSGNNYHHWRSLAGNGGNVVYSITEDVSGDIWAGTYYKGLYYFNHRQWKAMKHENETDANISAVAANASGQVLAVYERCIDEWYPNSRQFRHYNYRLDLGIDSTTNVLNCVSKDLQGNVYIPFEHGLLVFNNQRKFYDITPGVRITDIRVLLKPVTGKKKEFGYDENYFTFKFEGISFTNPERLNYRYKLEGLGDKWIATHDESITFPKLPPGNYIFRIQAALDGSFDHAKEDMFSFTIDAPLWKRPWFLILLGFMAFFIAYRLIKLREKGQKKLLRLEQERMNFEYEHLKSQVNPHFLFNSLNTLSNLIEEDADAAVSYTERLSDLYKNILVFRSRDLITLKEDWEILSNYVFVQKSRFGKALQVEFEVPETLMKTKKIVPMCLQMLVENAIKHNIVSLTQPLRIKIWSDNEDIIVSNPLQPKVSKEKGAGLGLKNISNRYRLLTKREVVFGVNKSEFVVRIPLL